MATTTYTSAGQRITRGTCLACPAVLDLLPGGAVPDHQDDTEQCDGAGFRPAQDDGRDDVRREAIRHWRALRGLSALKRADLATNLGKTGWRMRDLMDTEVRAVVIEESEADLWRDLAMHGDWWETARRAIALLGRRALTTDDVDRGLEAWGQAGARAWLRTANTSLQADLRANPGPMADALSNVLFTL